MQVFSATYNTPTIHNLSIAIYNSIKEREPENTIKYSQVQTWVGDNFGAVNKDNNKKMASLNNYVSFYYNSKKGLSSSAVTTSKVNDLTTAQNCIDALISSISNSTIAGLTNYLDDYDNDNTSQFLRRFESDNGYDPGAIFGESRNVEIPKLTTLAEELYYAFKMKDYNTTQEEVEEYLNKYNTSNSTDMKYLANIAKAIYVNNDNNSTNNDNSISDIWTQYRNDQKYERTPYYNSGTYTFTQSSTDTNLNPNESTKWYWDESDPEVFKAISMWKLLSAFGYIIASEEASSNEDYLNNMISNAQATLVKFDISKVSDSDRTISEMSNEEFYDIIDFEETSIATDTNIFEVSDTTQLKQAEAEYEAGMRKINIKENRIDTQLSELETERTAIKTEKDTLGTVIKDNINMSFKLFS